MNARSTTAALVLLLGLPFIANATPVHLDFSGTLAIVANVEDPPAGFVPGAAFHLVVSYDTAESSLGTNPGTFGGSTQTYSGGSLDFDLYFGAACNPCSPGGNNSAMSLISVFDDRDLSNDGIANPADGLSFILIDTSQATQQRWGLNLSSPNTSILSGTGLPTALGGPISGFLQVCDLLPIQIPLSPTNNAFTFPCSPQGLLVAGAVTLSTPPAPVPEPATLTLFGLGLAGVGLMQRRRRAKQRF